MKSAYEDLARLVGRALAARWMNILARRRSRQGGVIERGVEAIQSSDANTTKMRRPNSPTHPSRKQRE